MTNGTIVIAGAVGTGSSLLAWYVAHRDEMIKDLQVVSLIMGISVAAATLWKLFTKKRKAKKHHEG